MNHGQKVRLFNRFHHIQIQTYCQNTRRKYLYLQKEIQLGGFHYVRHLPKIINRRFIYKPHNQLQIKKVDHHFQQRCMSQFGTYRSVGPSTKTSRGTTLVFQTPHIGGSLRQEAEEGLQNIGLFQHVANYSRKMEQNKIELSKLKSTCERGELEKQELES